MLSITLTNHFQKILGLMGKRTPLIAILEYPQPTFVSIHTWFMYYPINLYYLDENYDLIETKMNLKPFSYYIPGNKARYVVEVPV